MKNAIRIPAGTWLRYRNQGLVRAQRRHPLTLRTLFQADIQRTVAAIRLSGDNLLSNIRVLVVDDYAPWMNFVSAALAANPQFQVVGEAGDGLTALQKVAELNPDLVVLDIGLPDMSGITVAQQIMVMSPKVRILFLSENTAPEIVRAALRTGAQGYVVKSAAARELLPALDALLLDCYFVSASANHFGPGDGPLFSRLTDA